MDVNFDRDANIGSVDALNLKYEQQKNDEVPQKFEVNYLNTGKFTAGAEVAIPTPYGSVTGGYEYAKNSPNADKKGEETSTAKLGYGAVVGGTAQAEVNHNTGNVNSSATVVAGFKVGFIIVVDVEVKTGVTTDKIKQ